MLEGRFDLVLQTGDAIGEEGRDQDRRNHARDDQSGEDEHGHDDAEEQQDERESVAKASARDGNENFDAFFGA